MIPLTIWMNMPSFHQDGLFNSLRDGGQVELRVVFARETTRDRLRLGWTEGVRRYSHRVLRHPKLWQAVRLAWSSRRGLHIVSGIWAEPSFAGVLCVLALARSRFVVYAEAPDPGQARTRMRAFLRRSFGGWVAKRALGFLAVSHFAEQFYTQLGFAREDVYPFGYFQTSNDWTECFPRQAAGQRTEIIFVGQLIPRKGVDILLEAIRPLFGEHPNLFLTVIGHGSHGGALQASAHSLGIAARVNFEGTVSSDRIQSRIASADVLVLPSRWDGWGMVVNEALSAGVPVIASDHCGAADLVQHGVNGYVFRSEDVEDLRGCLRRFLEDEDRRVAIRAAAANTGRAVSAESAAPYLIECLKHMTGASSTRPIPPWTLVTASQDARH